MLEIPMNHITTMMPSTGFTTKYEEYAASNQDQERIFFGAAWQAMLFTPATGHTLNGVKLAIYRVGDCGEVDVSIQALSGGDPDGTDLSLTKVPQSRLALTSPQVVEISMPAILLVVSTQYAIVVRAPDGADSSNAVIWDSDGSSPTYAGGHREDSANSGNTWTAQTGVDFIFEEWGFA